MSNRLSECPICYFVIPLEPDLEESEIITCPDCQSKLVVSNVQESNITLEEAPVIEEDWGE